MKKARGYIAFGLVTALLLGACGKAPAGNTPTEAPKPTVTATIEPTEAPDRTDAPEGVATATPAATLGPNLVTSGKDVTYEFSEMSCQTAKYVSYEKAADGGLTLKFDKQWGEIRLLLPEGIDFGQCISASVKMNTNGNEVMFQFFDKKALDNKYAKEVENHYYCIQNGTTEYLHFPESGKEVYAISFLAAGEVKEGQDFSVTLYSVTFDMVSGETLEIPTDIAPDVTEDMTLLNTYGKEFGKIGTCISLDEIKNPANVALLKKQYNSITSGWQAKMDQLIVSTPTLVSVAEAKKLGYVIPENYKETVVPKFNFDTLDETLKLCAENDLYYRVHTLIWHQQALDWFFRTDYAWGAEFVSPEVMDARMELYIRTVVQHVCDSPYADVVYAWDVVNEYLHFDNVNYENYTAVYGPIEKNPEFVKLAFEITDDVLKENGRREQISLFYNDYFTFTTEWGQSVSNPDRILSLVNFINSDGKVCDGVGMQAHIVIADVPKWKTEFKQATKKFLDAGLEVQLTEFDVNRYADAITEEVQADVFVAIMRDMLELKKAGGNISAIVFWGIADNIAGNRQYKPLMFETVEQPKDAYYKVLQAYVDAGKEEGKPTATPKPEATQKPAATTTPEPAVTKQPVATATPKPTATPVSSVTPRPSATPVPTKAPETEVAYTYKLKDMKVLRNYAASYEETGDAALKLQFENQYTSVLLMLPEEIDMRYCKKVSIKMRNEYQPVCVDFYDKNALVEEWPTAVHSEYFQCENGVVEYECSPSMDAKLSAISFMSLEEVDDFSKYITTVYSITFYMEKGHEPEARPTPTPYPKRDVLTKKGDTTYNFNDMEVVSAPNVEYKVQKDGSVDLQHSENWSTIRFALPKVIDMSRCTAITVKADSLKPFAVSFYGEEALYSSNGKELFIKYDFDKNKEYEYNVYPETTEKIYGIGIMSMEEIPAGSLYDVSVESITFHMVNDDATIPMKIAPDVTGDMTLLNTYGTKLDYIGTGATVAELKHPLRLQQIKEQCNSITLPYESKFDALFDYEPIYMSVTEAKKQGYVIPENYTDKTVPVFNFSALDETLTICAENELGFRFHTLVWHESTRTWFSGKAILRTVRL
ncbi:MAG: endo-1,4-beta-xylanase [Lachnospiraceae bacterium]|nr:endo-1,4-beta-xylanase [Lachnospiraceae bacterium]